MQINNKKKHGGAKPDKLPPCEGFVVLPKYGNHPVMDVSHTINKPDEPALKAESHIPDEILEEANSLMEKANQLTNNFASEENIMENFATQQSQTAGQQAADMATHQNQQFGEQTMQQSVDAAQNAAKQTLKEGDVGFITYGKGDKVHWAVAAGVGAVIGAAVNFDQPLATMAVGAVTSGIAAGVTHHYVDDYSAPAAVAAALAVGTGVRFLAPTVGLGKAKENDFVLPEVAPEFNQYA